MKNYKSELIIKILEQRGHEKSALHYESECIETWVNEAKGAYPKLCDYQSEWLKYIKDVNGGGGVGGEEPKPEPPIGEFPYETVTTNNTATVNHVVPFEYKSAILKGYSQRVFSPTKNLFDKEKIAFDRLIDFKTGNIITEIGTNTTDFIKVIPNTQYTMSFNFTTNAWTRCFGLTEPKHGKYVTDANGASNKCYFDSGLKKLTFRTSPTTNYLLFSFGNGVEETFQLEKGMTATAYEEPNYELKSVQMPVLTTTNEDGTKSIVLTVNEDVTLRSNGNVRDELDMLTGKLTQRIDEDGSVLTQEIVKTVDLTVVNQDGEPLSKIKPLEGTMHISTDGTPLKPTAVLEVPVEAITQNIYSFIEED